MYQFILASESPRRRQLLQTAGFVFTVHPVKVSETPDKNLNIDEQILDIAGRKAKAALTSVTVAIAAAETDLKQPLLLLAADTMVVFQDEALGKPESPEQAHEFLRRLSGQIHFVKTALCLVSAPDGKAASHIETSEVRFRSLTDEEIWSYIQTGEPMDKAGAYAIQGIGAKFVESYTGDFNNVVGLPVTALEAVLHANHWHVERCR